MLACHREGRRRAGVEQPTIYLRYPGKAELATAALASYRDRGRPAESGDTHADLVARLSSSGEE